MSEEILQPVTVESATVTATSPHFDDTEADRLAIEANALATDLERIGVDASMVKGLRELGLDLKKADTPWLQLDLYNAFNSGPIMEQIRRRQTPRATGLRRFMNVVEWLRNALTVAPIMLTWLALNHAVKAYGLAIQLDPTLANTPFLILWETGFKGQLASQGWFAVPLSDIARIDFWLLLAILVLTLITHVWNDVVADEQHRQAQILGARLDGLLWSINKLFVPRRFKLETDFNRRSLELIRSVEQMRDELQKHSASFGEMARLEAERLTQLREDRTDEVASLKEFAESLKSSTTQLKRFGEPMRELLNGFNTSVQQVERAVVDLTQVEQGLRTAMSVTGEQLQAAVGPITAQSENLQRVATQLGNANQETSQKLSEFAEAVQTAVGQTQTLTAGYQDLRKTLADERTNTGQAVAYIHQALGQLGKNLTGLQQLIEKLEPVGETLSSAATINHLASDRFGEMVEEIRAIKDAIEKESRRNEGVVNAGLVSGLNETILKLSQLEQHLSKIAQAVNVAQKIPLDGGNGSSPDWFGKQ